MPEKTIAQKLLIKPETAFWVAADADLDRLGPLPPNTRRVSSPGEAGVAILFVDSEASLRQAIADDGAALAGVPVLWVAYPKGGRADVNRDSLWPVVAELGLRPISQVAVDDIWSALRFRPLAPGEPQFVGR
jgi:hypothetical protein